MGVGVKERKERACYVRMVMKREGACVGCGMFLFINCGDRVVRGLFLL